MSKKGLRNAVSRKKLQTFEEKNYLISLVWFNAKKKFLNFLKKLTLLSLLIRKKLWILLQYMFFFSFHLPKYF